MPSSYLSRVAESEVGSLLKRFPAVAIVGPRQVGKTTLAQKISAASDLKLDRKVIVAPIREGYPLQDGFEVIPPTALGAVLRAED